MKRSKRTPYTKTGDHHDPVYYVRIVRAHEYAESQAVSLLEISGIGPATLRALWKGGIRTADQLRATSPAEIIRVLVAGNPAYRNAEFASAAVSSWHQTIEELRAKRSATRAT